LGANESFKKVITSSRSQPDEIYDYGSHEWNLEQPYPVIKAHWMKAPFLLPIIANKYQISQLVLYDNGGTYTKMLMVFFALQLLCIVMTNQNAVYPQIQALDCVMTLLLAGMLELYYFVSNLISCCFSILILVHKI